MPRTFILLLFLFVLNHISAQKLSTITGTVTNRKDRAIPFANVVLYQQNDSSMVKGTTSNDKGKFIISGVSNGEYYLSILFMGFEPTTISNISVVGNHINLKKIKLRRQPNQLEEITVISEKGMFENQAGKMVYNVDSNIAASGGVADELLQNIPSISVDMDNKVTVRGTKATVLIDGIEGGLADMLDQIPADAIGSIEVITNPSVRYDSKKGGSIINIKLKKQANKGYNGKVAAGVGTLEKRDFNLNLGQNNRKWRYSGAFNYHHKLQETEQYNQRFTEKAGKASKLEQEQVSHAWTDSYFGNIIATRFFAKKNFISFKYTLQNRNQERESNSFSENFLEEVLSSSNELKRLGYNSNMLHQFAGNFKTNQKKGVLEGGIIYSYNTPQNGHTQTSTPIHIGTGEPSPNYREDSKSYDNRNQILKSNIDLSRPLSPKTYIETGLLISYNSFTQIVNSSRIYHRPSSGSANEESIEKQFTNQNFSPAAYLLFGTQYNKYSVSAGLRLEHLNNQSESDTLVQTSYFKLIPSVHVKKQVSERYLWELSFTARTTPPTQNQLNPISTSFGNYHKSSGNPDLKPEYFHQFEWSNRWKLEKSNYGATFFFRNQTDIIGRYYFLELEQGKQISHSVYENIGELRSAGLDFSSMHTFGKLKIRPSVLAYYSTMDGDKFASTLDREELSYTVKIAANYPLNKKINFQCTANYYSPFISVYGKQYAYFRADAGVRAKALKNKATVSLKIVDMFASHEYDKEVNQREDMLKKSHINPNSFWVYMNFSYQFNSLKKRKRG